MLEFFHKLGLPMDASAHGRALDDLNVYVHWVMLILFVGWGLFFLYMIWRFRAGNHANADHAGMKSHAHSYVEISVIIIEFVLLIGFSIPLWATHVDAFPDPETEDVTDIRVVAQQFVWNIHYPGPDGVYGERRPDLVDPETNPIGLNTDDPHSEDDIWTVNDMRFPVNKPVVVRLTSLDVIHCFYLPQMRVKQDIFPGMDTPAWFVPVKLTPEGANWQIACAQLCGVGHYRMAGRYHSVSQADFDAWYEARHAEMVEEAEADDW